MFNMFNTNSGKEAPGGPERKLKRRPSASSLHDSDGKAKKQKPNHVSFDPKAQFISVITEFAGSDGFVRAISPDPDSVVQTPEDSWFHISKYLEPEVEPVTLPERDPIQKFYHKGTETYPPLILDGASGVGKTQQAFALLKGGQKQEAQQLVYFNLATSSQASDTQDIYRAMNDQFEMKNLHSKIDLALKEVREWGKKSDERSI